MAKEEKRERRRVDFNRIVRNLFGVPYPSNGGLPLRLGAVAVNSIEAATGQRGTPLEPEERLRLNNLAQKIINMKLDDSVESAPFTVVMLPRKVIDKLDGFISAAGYTTGVYSASHRLLYGEEAKDLEFDDIEVEGVPEEYEKADTKEPVAPAEDAEKTTEEGQRQTDD